MLFIMFAVPIFSTRNVALGRPAYQSSTLLSHHSVGDGVAGRATGICSLLSLLSPAFSQFPVRLLTFIILRLLFSNEYFGREFICLL